MRLGLVVVMYVAACGGGTPDSCPGARPSIADCFQGAFFAECGGSGAAKFACTDSDCKWFTGGCVAAEYTASDCPADDLCCVDNFPYGSPNAAASRAIYGYGRGVWDRSFAMNIPVSIDATLAPSMPTVMCMGTYPANGTPCSQGSTPVKSMVATNTLQVRLEATGVEGWNLGIEAIQDPISGSIKARVCELPYTDTFSPMCPATDKTVCAVDGAVSITRWPTTPGAPTDIGVTFDVTFGAHDLHVVGAL